MNKIIFSILFTFLVDIAGAQSDCNLQWYNTLIFEGDNYFKTGNYEFAMKNYNAAMTACKDKRLEVQKKIESVFVKINQLKLDAEIAKIDAINQKDMALAALKKADLMQEKVETAMFDKAVKEHFNDWKGFSHYDTELINKIIKEIDSLDLSSNALLRIPKEVTKCPGLRVIDLYGNPDIDWKASENTLKELRNSVEIFVSVEEDLAEIDSSYWHLITGIEISSDSLPVIPQNIIQQTQLKYFAPWGIHLQILPREIGQLKNLIEFDLSANELETLPQEIEKLTYLKLLDLSENKLETLPAEICRLTNLTELDLSYNELRTLPQELEGMINLEVLNLERNRLDILPTEICKLKNLTELNLSSNILTKLPAEIRKLSNLRELHLSFNKLRTLPREIEGMINLEVLNLTWNRLDTLPAEIWKLTNLTELDLSETKLGTLPNEIYNLTNLTELDLSYNELKTLPREIEGLIYLKFLDLSENKLDTLPAEICRLTNLTELNLSSNILTKLPAEIRKLSNLKELDLSYNKLRTLPREIEGMINLEVLNLNGNELDTLPAEILKLINLTELNLSETKLDTLPTEICNLTNLTELDLSGNELKTLPGEIEGLTNLRRLYLYGNPLKSIPYEVFDLNLETGNFSEISQMLVKSKNYGQTYLIAKKLIMMEPDNYRNWFNLSFYCLFVEKFAEGIQAAQKSLELAPEKSSVITNLASGYVLSNQYEKAKPLYLEWKDKKFPDNERFAKDIFLQDISDLEEAKITHPDFEKVRELLYK